MVTSNLRNLMRRLRNRLSLKKKEDVKPKKRKGTVKMLMSSRTISSLERLFKWQSMIKVLLQL